MEQIVVPQFLDVEDKIIGPITVRQFLEMMVGGIVIFIFYKIFDFSLFLFSALIVVLLVMTFAFVKIGGQAFHNFLLNFISTMKNPKLKVWKKILLKEAEIKVLLKQPTEQVITTTKMVKSAVSSSRLSELSLIVDTGGAYRGEEVVNFSSKVKN